MQGFADGGGHKELFAIAVLASNGKRQQLERRILGVQKQGRITKFSGLAISGFLNVKQQI